MSVVFFPRKNGVFICWLPRSQYECSRRQQLAARMPAKAKQDLLEWDPSQEVSAYIERVVTNEYSVPPSSTPTSKSKLPMTTHSMNISCCGGRVCMGIDSHLKWTRAENFLHPWT